MQTKEEELEGELEEKVSLGESSDIILYFTSWALITQMEQKHWTFLWPHLHPFCSSLQFYLAFDKVPNIALPAERNAPTMLATSRLHFYVVSFSAQLLFDLPGSAETAPPLEPARLG